MHCVYKLFKKVQLKDTQCSISQEMQSHQLIAADKPQSKFPDWYCTTSSYCGPCCNAL